jgi:hypothetical protein
MARLLFTDSECTELPDRSPRHAPALSDTFAGTRPQDHVDYKNTLIEYR